MDQFCVFFPAGVTFPRGPCGGTGAAAGRGRGGRGGRGGGRVGHFDVRGGLLLQVQPHQRGHEEIFGVRFLLHINRN
jgi:hypothetical protein